MERSRLLSRPLWRLFSLARNDPWRVSQGNGRQVPGDLVGEAQPIVEAPPQGVLSSVGLKEGGIADQAGAGDVGIGDRHGSVRHKCSF